MGTQVAEIWTVRSILAWTRTRFRERAVEAADLSAELLLAHVLGCERLDLYLDIERPLTPDERAAYRACVQRRLRAEPVAYIVGHRDFHGLRFEVSPAVLVPRPDSELLVELALGREPAPRRVLDLGTGSGALAIALAAELHGAQVVGLDNSPAALEVARRNGARHGVAVEWVEASWEGDLAGRLETGFDLVVSNPPYVARDDELGPGVREHEPAAALFSSGPLALDATRGVLRTARALLAPGGAVLVEVGAGRAAAVCELAGRLGLGEMAVHRDLAGIERVVSGRQPVEREEREACLSP